MIRVLLADDSGIVRAILKQLMSDDGRFNVCGSAENGQRAVEQNEALKPDLIVMDINMPVMDGITATKKILADYNPAIIAFTTEDAVDVGYKCLEAGALEVIRKPDLIEMNQTVMKTFLDQFYLVAEKHVRNQESRSSKRKSLLQRIEERAAENQKPPSIQLNQLNQVNTEKEKYEVVTAGASTGGPAALLEFIAGLGKNFNLPLLITQHIDTNFDLHLVKWLKKNSGLDVRLAEDNTIPEKGVIYIAPADKHMIVTGSYDGCKYINLTDDEPVHYLRPAVDKLFSSAAEVYGDRMIAVILTGMGKDGAEGCKKAFDKGALTIAQDEKSCAVFGMPQAAINIGAVKHVLPIEEIAPFIRRKTGI
ncbi:chemotaxis-specific protein-glutamate methyltransferase CheB [Treponema sp.]|uniref:chemotaxis-specific protein-glutamate methyltransferase CheB n=1 Tax=Treponema sp. TaxID=166 RepID=UPI0025D1DD20|nr:chemotaxis-specific protein-glutamate methyltransferase CheB [Treponema sp.]MCR5218511.1 chemotaxis-specific protein-glutamate methyltransferase CheB [Treponema sp.]